MLQGVCDILYGGLWLSVAAHTGAHIRLLSIFMPIHAACCRTRMQTRDWHGVCGATSYTAAAT